MAYAEPPGPETCPICQCIITEKPPPGLKGANYGFGEGWKKKVGTPRLKAFGIDFLCDFCCPDDDREEIILRACAKAYKAGELEERRTVREFLNRYLPRGVQSLRDVRF